MFKKHIVLLAIMFTLLLLISGCSGSKNTTSSESKQPNGKEQPITLTLAVAGDTNMVELFQQAIAKEFQSKYPSIIVNVIGTGPGDPGSQAIFTKLDAQARAKADKWDIDVAVVHQSIMGDMIKNNLLARYVNELTNSKYVVGDAAKNSLGTDVSGYVVPMFQSQIAIAYRPEVKNPPSTFEELTKWIKENSKKFGYNGIKNGMSGVGFVTAWIYWKSGNYTKLTKGPYEETEKDKWISAVKELKTLPTTITNGNAGTLDMLNRGEIQMGPVWVDMYYTWIKEQRLDPNIKIKLIAPGLPGQPMYFILPAKAAHREAALKFIDFIASPEIQAKYIVERNGWYPGIEPEVVMSKVSSEAKAKLFESISKDDLAKYGLQFPLAQYLKDILRTYELN